MEVRSRPRSRRMNAHWMTTPITNMAGTVISNPRNRSMWNDTES